MKRQEKNGILFDLDEYASDSPKVYYVAVAHYNEYIGMVYRDEGLGGNWIAERFFQHDDSGKTTVNFKNRHEAASYLLDLHTWKFAGIPMFIK